MKKFYAAVFLTVLFLALADCNHGRPCMRLTGKITHEPYGATDISAVIGNQGLTAALNEAGTVTVFKWPNPSYYDQVKYMTGTRDQDNLGALENEGLFSGLYYERGGAPGFFWLRDLKVEQSYLSPTSVAVKTTFYQDELGLVVEQIDFVHPALDLMVRNYRVSKSLDSKVTAARLVAYLNFAPQITKFDFLPISDWCLDETGSSSLDFDETKDLFVQCRQGTDVSIPRPSSVCLAFGFEGGSQSHQAGLDSMCSLVRLPGKTDAYGLAEKGALPGSGSARGKVTAGLIRELAFNEQGQASAALFISAGKDEPAASSLIGEAREQSAPAALEKTENAWQERLKDVPLPATDDARIRELSLRSVIVALLSTCQKSGAIVASISTQPPYALDWPRDGAFINLALMEAGFPDLVRKRNLFLAGVQSRKGAKIRFVPAGNWASNYTADGVPGFPWIWWEIDETGWEIWSLVDYYELTGDREYLAEVYPAVKRAAEFLVAFRDPATGLQKKAFENDNPRKGRTLHGAMPVYLGLRFAARAAEAMGEADAARRFQGRADEIHAAILEHFYDPACGRLVSKEESKGKCQEGSLGMDASLALWPIELFEPGDPRADEAAQQAWAFLSKSFNGERDQGSYEIYGLLGLAKYWRGRPEKIELVRQGLDWCATVPTSELGHFGEIWITHRGRVIQGEGQPHTWHHSLFYLTALEVFGKE